MKLPIDSIYVKLSPHINDLSVIFEKMLWSVSVINIEEIGILKKMVFNMIIIDCRETVDDVEVAQKLLQKYHTYSILIYDEINQDKIHLFIESGVKFFLPYPISNEKLKERFKEIISVVSLENKLKRCESRLNCCKNRMIKEDVGKESCVELQKHIQMVEGCVKRVCRESGVLLEKVLSMNRSLIQSDLADGDIAFLGVALRSISQLQSIFEDLEHLVVPDERFTDSQNITFNLNTILENISVIMSKHWDGGKLNLIFNVSNDVPAKILGNPILLSKVLVEVLEIIIDIKKKGEIILDISTIKSDSKELLHFNPMKYMNLTPSQKERIKKIIYKLRFLRIRNLVEIMGGSFDIKGIEVVGLGFTIPLYKIDRRNYRLPSKKWMNKQVLILGENDFITSALEQMLNYFHYKVEKIKDISSAENRLYHISYDLIFLDEELFDAFEIYGYTLKRDAKVVVMAWPGIQKSRISDYLAKTDTVLIKPFTQQKVFDTILGLYSNDVLKERKESLNILRDNLSFVLHDKKALYIGNDDSNWLMIKRLLKGSLMGIMRTNSIESANISVRGSNLIILSPKIYESKGWRKWLSRCKNRCEEKNVIALIENPNPKLIKVIKEIGIDQYLSTPINPDNFYRILMEELIE